jgi:hypothetical protein
VTRKDKLLAALRRNPHAVRFTNACRAAELLGFARRGGQGSHCTYGREDEPLLLNFQDRDGYIKPYQARQLLAMLEKYGNDPAPLSD